MPQTPVDAHNRRRFLQFLAGSPLLATWGFGSEIVERLLSTIPDGRANLLERLQTLAQGTALIQSPDQAFNVMEFEPVAQANLPPAHFGYLASGVDDDSTLRANREGFRKYEIRPRRLIDVRHVDTSIRLFRAWWGTPIFLCPAGSQKAFHPEGEIATARAARAKGHLQILSGVSTTSVEDVNAARGMPVWYQLYPTDDVTVSHAIVRRAAAAGCPVLVVTVDLNAGRNLETQLRSAQRDSRQCSACHTPGVQGIVRRKPMFDGLDLSKASDLVDPSMTWDYVRRLHDVAGTMKLVIKGIVTREDAALAVQHGLDGIVVSNHGGRADETGRSTIESLPEVLQGVAGRIPVMIDGGFRRGTDIFKALALGATAVGIGRPYLWGLAAFGQAGVEAVLSILRRELELVMRQAATTSVGRITRGHVVRS
jgi:4-hydroxymandelate oxidase